MSSSMKPYKASWETHLTFKPNFVEARRLPKTVVSKYMPPPKTATRKRKEGIYDADGVPTGDSTASVFAGYSGSLRGGSSANLSRSLSNKRTRLGDGSVHGGARRPHTPASTMKFERKKPWPYPYSTEPNPLAPEETGRPSSSKKRKERKEFEQQFVDHVLDDRNESLRRLDPVEWRRQRERMNYYGVEKTKAEQDQSDPRYRHAGDFPNSPMRPSSTAGALDSRPRSIGSRHRSERYDDDGVEEQLAANGITLREGTVNASGRKFDYVLYGAEAQVQREEELERRTQQEQQYTQRFGAKQSSPKKRTFQRSPPREVATATTKSRKAHTPNVLVINSGGSQQSKQRDGRLGQQHSTSASGDREVAALRQAEDEDAQAKYLPPRNELSAHSYQEGGTNTNHQGRTSAGGHHTHFQDRQASGSRASSHDSGRQFFGSRSSPAQGKKAKKPVDTTTSPTVAQGEVHRSEYADLDEKRAEERRGGKKSGAPASRQRQQQQSQRKTSVSRTSASAASTASIPSRSSSSGEMTSTSPEIYEANDYFQDDRSRKKKNVEAADAQRRQQQGPHPTQRKHVYPDHLQGGYPSTEEDQEGSESDATSNSNSDSDDSDRTLTDRDDRYTKATTESYGGERRWTPNERRGSSGPRGSTTSESDDATTDESTTGQSSSSFADDRTDFRRPAEKSHRRGHRSDPHKDESTINRPWEGRTAAQYNADRSPDRARLNKMLGRGIQGGSPHTTPSVPHDILYRSDEQQQPPAAGYQQIANAQGAKGHSSPQRHLGSVEESRRVYLRRLSQSSSAKSNSSGGSVLTPDVKAAGVERSRQEEDEDAYYGSYGHKDMRTDQPQREVFHSSLEGPPQSVLVSPLRSGGSARRNDEDGRVDREEEDGRAGVVIAGVQPHRYAGVQDSQASSAVSYSSINNSSYSFDTDPSRRELKYSSHHSSTAGLTTDGQQPYRYSAPEDRMVSPMQKLQQKPFQAQQQQQQLIDEEDEDEFPVHYAPGSGVVV